MAGMKGLISNLMNLMARSILSESESDILVLIVQAKKYYNYEFLIDHHFAISVL